MLSREADLKTTERPVSSLQRIGVPLTTTIAASIGAAWLLLWSLGFPQKWASTPFITMKTNMAASLVLASCGLFWLSRKGHNRWLRNAGAMCGFAVFLIGILTLLEYLFGWNFGIDQLIFTEPPGASAVLSPNRMGPPATLSITLIGIGLVSLRFRKRALAPFLGIAVCLIILVPAIGYLYGAASFYDQPRLTAISWSTIPALMALGFGLVLTSTASGPLALLLRDDSGGRLLRDLLPATLILPVLFGYLRTVGQNAGLYEAVTGRALLVLSLTVIFSFLLWVSATRLSRSAAAEEASHQRLRLLFERAGVGIIEVDADFHFIDANQRACEILGYSAEELTRLSPSEITAPEDRLRSDELNLQLSRGRFESFRNEKRYLKRDGTPIWVHVTVAGLRDHAGKFCGAITTVEDISDRKRAELELRLSEEKFRATFESAAVGMGRVSFADARWIDTNQALCRMVGYSAEEMRSTPWPSITHPDDIDIDLVPFQKMAAGELHSYTVEKRFIHKDGHIVWARLTLSAVNNAEGVPEYEIAVVEDISESRRARKEIEERRDELQFALRAASAGSWNLQVGTDRFILGPESQSLLSMPERPTLPDAFERIVPEDQAKIEEELRACVEGLRDYAVQFRVRSANGELRWIEARGRRVEKDGQVWIYGINHDVTASKSAEEALRESERRFRALVEQASDAFFLHDDQGRFTDVNRQACESLGYTREELLRMTVFDVERDFDLESAQRAWRALTPGDPQTVYGNHRRKDGTVFPVEARLSCIELAGQSLYVGLVRDISDRVRAEEALRRSEQRLRRFYDSGMVGVFYWSADGAITDANDKFLEITGYTREALTSRQLNWQRMTPPEYHALDIKYINEVKATGIHHPREKEFIRSDGTRVPLIVGAASLNDSGSEGVAFVLDITERKQAEMALRASEARFKALAENVPQMIWVADAETNFFYLSPKWLEYTGTTLAENANGGWAENVHPDDRARALEVWQAAIQSKTAYQTEFRIRRFDGEYHWHLSRAVPMFDPETNQARWFGTTTDIQDQKRAQEALIRSEKLASVGRMAATVAHEINNPLELVMNSVFLASLDKNLSERARESLDAAEKELERVAHLVRQTLGFYRENSAPTTVDPVTLVEDVVKMYAPKLTQRNINFKYEHSGTLRIRAIAGEIRQVVSNIVANAIDASVKGGELRVRASSVSLNGKRSVRLTFADTGEGIRPENLSHIFEPFFTTKQSVGTGLGLWVTREIVQRHNGKLRVRSQKGKGSVFSILLPELEHPTSN